MRKGQIYKDSNKRNKTTFAITPPSLVGQTVIKKSGSYSGSKSSFASPSQVSTQWLVKFAHSYSGGTASAFNRFIYYALIAPDNIPY